MSTKRIELASWGRYPRHDALLRRPERYADFKPEGPACIARGQGRSYGDAALNEDGLVMLSERIDRMLACDWQQGVLRVEAGVTLDDILKLIVPRGWFLPVTPGTCKVSVGGCVAADVHGKNHHHDGAFGNFVDAIELIAPDGALCCSPEDDPELFQATLGGVGLTGFIGEVALRLRPIESTYIAARHHAARNLDELFRYFTDADYDDAYTVAWIDGQSQGAALGRGVLMCGHHAAAEELHAAMRDRPFADPPTRAVTVPFDVPSWVLNPLSIGMFNWLYYRLQSRKLGPFLAGYRKFFYPLDGISEWNRLYGKRGFLQYQCVIPELHAFEGVRLLLEKLAASGHSSFLAVLKRMGAASQGMLSFPMPGYSLALDLTMGDARFFTLLDELDDIVVRHGGRVYLAKDARLRAETFRAMYPRYGEWLAVKRRVDPRGLLSSSLSRRLRIGEDA